MNVKGGDLSVLSLGTVQLGLNYGINNANGKPSQETANAILDAALELTDAQMAEIRELFLDTPDQVLQPNLWPKVQK